jgi:hypothetical protein
MVLVEEPAAPKDVWNLKDGWAIILSLQGSNGDSLSHKRGGAISKIKFILFHLFHLIPYLNLLFWG